MERIGDILAREKYPQNTENQKKSSETKTMTDQDIITGCEEQKAKFGYASNPHCAVCRGLGSVHPILPEGKTDYSQVINCQAQGCIVDQKSIYESTEAYIRGKGVSKFNTFDSFKPVLGAEDTLDAFKDIAFNPDAPPLLIVYGTTGNGKTHLCEATVIELLKRGVDCRLWAVSELLSNLKESISQNTTELLIGRLKKLPALILDEWGQNYGSEWEEQKLEEIVIARDREGLVTIITSNLEPDKMMEDPERLISRFGDRTQARLIRNKAPDYRPKKKAKRSKG